MSPHTFAITIYKIVLIYMQYFFWVQNVKHFYVKYLFAIHCLYRNLYEEREGRLPLRDAVEKRPIPVADRETLYKYLEVGYITYLYNNKKYYHVFKTLRLSIKVKLS